MKNRAPESNHCPRDSLFPEVALANLEYVSMDSFEKKLIHIDLAQIKEHATRRATDMRDVFIIMRRTVSVSRDLIEDAVHATIFAPNLLWFQGELEGV